MQHTLWLAAILCILQCRAEVFAEIADESILIEEIVVTADLRERRLADVPVSVSILDARFIQQRAIQHFEELTNTIPNLNWSGDGHRARYFQIRGVGELEQYQGAPNPSVGVLIDDIDFSGIGTIATLWDLDRIEVLRGPQGTRYGANAIGGLIYMRSRAPGDEFNGRLQLLYGGDDAQSLGVAAGGGVGTRARLRVSAHRHESNGFRSNTFLDREDTNGRKETTLRGKLELDATPSWQVDLAMLHSDIANGYDAFALDNSYTVLSDKPGRDAQRSRGASLRIENSDSVVVNFTSITAYADSDLEFGFDADWGNDDSWAPFIYDYVSFSERKRRTLSQEFRLGSGEDARIGSANWLLGAYALRLEEDLLTVNQGEYFDPFFDFADSLDDTLQSDYEATNVAVFGELDIPVAAATTVSMGLRVERRETTYSDSTGLKAGPAETMLGGALTLNHVFDANLSVYSTLSRGYKAGGFNLGVVPPGRRNFDQEVAWNFELGLRKSWWNGSMQLNAALFAGRREDQQVRTSFQLDPNDPTTFVFFTDNAAKGKSFGLEAELRWRPTDTLDLYANLGLLRAEFDDFENGAIDLSGRDQAHAPRYMVAAGGRYQHPGGVFVQLDASAKDDFYFDVSHNEKSTAYGLLSARAGYAAPAWSITIWVRNLADERYAVRGFFFGNEPPNFPPTLYTRLGDARQVGLTFDLEF